MKQNEAISILQSPTIWGLIFMSVLSINPVMEAVFERGYVRPKDTWQVFYLLAGTGLGAVLRVAEGGSPIYTPQGVVGPNKDEFATVTTRTSIQATTTTNADTGEQHSIGVVEPTIQPDSNSSDSSM